LAAGLALLGVSGCAAARIEGGVFHSPKGYRVTLPERWQAAADGRADLELRRPTSRSAMLVNATCEGKAPGRPLAVLARHLLFGLERREILEQRETVLAGRPALRVALEGRLDGEPVRVEAYVVKGERCVYDLLHVAPPAEFDAGRREFDALAGSLATE
jgi:hypothetical protein